LCNHGGKPLPEDIDFFAEPPAEIGPLLSAYSTLRHGKRPWSVGGRLIVGGGVGMLGLLGGGFLVSGGGVPHPFWQAAWPLGLGGAALIAGLLCTGFSHTCTYVGREGIARFTCSGSRDHLEESEILLFRNATELRTSQTRRYVNGVYQGTSYSFSWSDVGGRVRYELNGTYKSAAGTPSSTDPFQFARAGEFAWTVYLLGEARRQVELAGSVPFNLKGGQWIRLGPGTVTLCLQGEPLELRAEALAGVVVQQGVVVFKE